MGKHFLLRSFRSYAIRLIVRYRTLIGAPSLRHGTN
jgi:hypothetical protein